MYNDLGVAVLHHFRLMLYFCYEMFNYELYTLKDFHEMVNITPAVIMAERDS